MPDDKPAAEVDVTKAWAATQDQKGAAKRLRIYAALAWVVAIGLIEARLHVMAFAEGSDDDAVRIISLRPAEKHETRFYYGQI